MIFQYFYTFLWLSMERNPFSAKNQTLRPYRAVVLNREGAPPRGAWRNFQGVASPYMLYNM